MNDLKARKGINNNDEDIVPTDLNQTD